MGETGFVGTRVLEVWFRTLTLKTYWIVQKKYQVSGYKNQVLEGGEGYRQNLKVKNTDQI